jgi:hypothetical protein
MVRSIILFFSISFPIEVQESKYSANLCILHYSLNFLVSRKEELLKCVPGQTGKGLCSVTQFEGSHVSSIDRTLCRTQVNLNKASDIASHVPPYSGSYAIGQRG